MKYSKQKIDVLFIFFSFYYNQYYIKVGTQITNEDLDAVQRHPKT